MNWRIVNYVLLVCSITAGFTSILTFTGGSDVPGWLGGILFFASFVLIRFFFSIRGVGDSPSCSFSESPFSLRSNPLNFYYIGGVLLSAHGLAGLVAALLSASNLWRIALPYFCIGMGCIIAVRRIAHK